MALQTIGLLAGMSWTSSIEYYRIINRTVQDRLGGSNSARLVMYSVNFAEHLAVHERGGWEGVAEEALDIARILKTAGADFLVMGVNTLHMVADRIEAAGVLPLLHIADATAAYIKAKGMKRVGLVGTRYTMCEDFYRVRMARRHGIEVVVPGEEDVEALDRIIFDELVRDIYEDRARLVCLEIIDRLVAQGVEGIVLGCTELPILVPGEMIPLPSFDTLAIHATAAAERAMG